MLFDIFKKKPRPQQLPFATDIHCHVVPGVDDGSPDVETSVKLLRHMSDWGIRRVFASPHSTQDTFENTPQSLREPFETLCEAVKAEGLPLEMYHHAEYRLDEFFISQLNADNLKPLPGNYILVENSFSQEPWNMDQLLFNLRVAGFIPILAHPERYFYYSRNHRDRYEKLHHDGLLFQVNLLSLAGHYGKYERETARWMLENGMVDFIGTDVHRMSHIESIEAYLASRNFTKDIKYLNNLHNDTL